MEIDEIRNCWKEEDKRISTHVKINRNASFEKLRSSFDKIRIRRLIHLVLMCATVPLIFVLIVFPQMKNDGSAGFYAALASFSGLIAFLFLYHIYYYICLLKIDFAVSIVKAQKEILRLELFDKRLNGLRFIFVPAVMVCVFKIFGIPMGRIFGKEMEGNTVVMLVVIGVVMVVSAIVKLKILIPREYKEVKTFLEELEEDKGK